MSKRTRKWIFTLNNPDKDLSRFIDELMERVRVRYVVVGRETAPTTGTPHWQGFIEFENPATFEQVQARIPGAHIEPARGSAWQNRAYCTKGGDFEERGQITERVQVHEQAHEVLALIQAGLNPVEIALNQPELAGYVVKHYHALRSIYKDVSYKYFQRLPMLRRIQQDEHDE